MSGDSPAAVIVDVNGTTATVLPANTSPTSADKALVVSISPNSPFPASDPLQEVPFTYATPSPLIIQALQVGQRIEFVNITITTSFNDAAAELKVGTVSQPTAMLDIPNPVVAEYENEELFLVSLAELFRLTILPGTSTQGAGILFYRIKV